MKRSAGILLYRRSPVNAQRGFSSPSPQPSPSFEFLLVHPGGPFWAKKDEHAWSIPKGETGETGETSRSTLVLSPAEVGSGYGEIEKVEDTARREFCEETGRRFEGELTPLPQIKAAGKIIYAFLGEGDFDPARLKSNEFEIEWPPRSGKMASFPEVDKAAWFDAETAKMKIHKGQIPLIDAAIQILNE